MMQKPIAYARFVNVARLRIAYFEVVIATMTVRLVRQVAVERENIGHEIPCELLHVSATTLPFYKFSPCFKEILDRNDILIGMSGLDSSKRPPNGFCRYLSGLNMLIFFGTDFIRRPRRPIAIRLAAG